MLTNPAATTVLCFGDSNTHGAPDAPGNRLAADVRWTGQLQRILGERYYVIEEGLNGRTIDMDYPDRPGLNGRTYLTPCLLTHSPLDIIVLMLGTNDTKVQFGRSAEAIALSWHGFLDDLFAVAFRADGSRPDVVLVSPIHIDPTQPLADMETDSFDAASVAKAAQLSALYAAIAKERGLRFLDAAAVAAPGADSIHLTVASHAALAELIATEITSR
ncbi:GDSL-type esterase/lipase family protein [Catelliglobosispora koreensis]|uniref:GDSL-type esterase/lipase family protein n=1 Tax=Catelliglobosispora koreensis TaxID=129052 RepID=UPI00036524CC|nr:GDSL-type esterase/lipase family protein [Catelliglobosispora koreensis]